MHALWSLSLPVSVKVVRYGFDCPYHGKDCCDPEGGVCKRYLDALQMKMQKAFDSCIAAFQEMNNHPHWKKEGASRPKTTSRLGLFIESRSAVWVDPEQLRSFRQKIPRLAPLPGIKSSVYGLTWTPGAKFISVFPLLCLCPGCLSESTPRPPCLYPKLVTPTQHSFRVQQAKGFKPVTLPRLKAFLSVKAPRVSRSGAKPALLIAAANVLIWAQGEREACTTDAALLKAVTDKIVAIENADQQVREAKEAQALEAARQLHHAQELCALAQAQMRDASAPGASPEKVLDLQQTIIQLDQIRSSSSPQPLPVLPSSPPIPTSSAASSAVSSSSSSALGPAPAVKRKKAQDKSQQHKRVLLTLTPAAVAEAVVQALSAGDIISVMYDDAGWLFGRVSRVEAKSIYITWPCAEPSCPTQSASGVCTHGEDDSDGRDVSRFLKTKVVKDLQKGEVRVGDSLSEI